MSTKTFGNIAVFVIFVVLPLTVAVNFFVQDYARKSQVRATYFECDDYEKRSEDTCRKRTLHYYGGKLERQYKDYAYAGAKDYKWKKLGPR